MIFVFFCYLFLQVLDLQKSKDYLKQNNYMSAIIGRAYSFLSERKVNTDSEKYEFDKK